MMALVLAVMVASMAFVGLDGSIESLEGLDVGFDGGLGGGHYITLDGTCGSGLEVGVDGGIDGCLEWWL